MFKLLILLTQSSSKLIVILLNLGKSKLTLLIHVFKLWAGQNYFTVFWQDVRPEETIQTLSFRQKIQESPKMAQVIFKDSICGNQEDKKSFT